MGTDVGDGVVGVTVGRGVEALAGDRFAVAVGVVKNEQAFRKKAVVMIKVVKIMFLPMSQLI